MSRSPRLAARLALTAAVAALPVGASPGNDYMLQCQGCHRADGSGLADSVPDLRDQIGLFLEVPGGREFLIQVPGSAQSALSNAELAAVLNWMIERFGPTTDRALFTEAEVAASRQPLAEVSSVRDALMRRIRDRQTRP